MRVNAVAGIKTVLGFGGTGFWREAYFMGGSERS